MPLKRHKRIKAMPTTHGADEPDTYLASLSATEREELSRAWIQQAYGQPLPLEERLKAPVPVPTPVQSAGHGKRGAP
jgi:hypothetical protein